MDKLNVNININKDDNSINDYLYCWAELGQRPNKITLYNHYKSDEFIEFISKIRLEYNGLFTEVIPTGTDYILNEKTLLKIGDTIYISYTHYDKLSDEKIIGEVCLIYLNKAVDEINNILKKLE